MKMSKALLHLASEYLKMLLTWCMLSGWWFKPEYIINELNINAAITSPAHDEVVALRPQPYTVRGYAYTGASACCITLCLSWVNGVSGCPVAVHCPAPWMPVRRERDLATMAGKHCCSAISSSSRMLKSYVACGRRRAARDPLRGEPGQRGELAARRD